MHPLRYQFTCNGRWILFYLQHLRCICKRRKILFDPFFHPDENYINHSYDYIFSCEVFEHFHEPKQEIEKLLQLLKPGGRLYIMTHLYDLKINFEHWYYRNDPTHVFIYTHRTIEFIAEKYALTLEEQTDRLVVLRKQPT